MRALPKTFLQRQHIVPIMGLSGFFLFLQYSVTIHSIDSANALKYAGYAISVISFWMVARPKSLYTRIILFLGILCFVTQSFVHQQYYVEEIVSTNQLKDLPSNDLWIIVINTIIMAIFYFGSFIDLSRRIAITNLRNRSKAKIYSLIKNGFRNYIHSIDNIMSLAYLVNNIPYNIRQFTLYCAYGIILYMFAAVISGNNTPDPNTAAFACLFLTITARCALFTDPIYKKETSQCSTA